MSGSDSSGRGGGSGGIGAIAVRQARLELPAEAAALVEILDSYARGPAGQNAPLSDEARAALIPGLRGHPRMTVLFAFEGERPVGAAVCFEGFSTFAGRASLNLHDFAVLPDARGRGIGSRLLDEVVEFARQRGCCKLTLEVHETNAGAQRLYRRSGFGPADSTTLFLTRPL